MGRKRRRGRAAKGRRVGRRKKRRRGRAAKGKTHGYMQRLAI
jgi:hypothetical protein